MKKSKPVREINQLGELEAEVLGVVWEMKQATVQEVKDALEPRRSLAYTTVMTVMSRLAEKGILERRKEGEPIITPRLPPSKK